MVILPDADRPDPNAPDLETTAATYAATFARRAREAGAPQVVTLALEGLPNRGDVVEWLAAGHDGAELARLAGEALAAAGKTGETGKIGKTGKTAEPTEEPASEPGDEKAKGERGPSDAASAPTFTPVGVRLSDVKPQTVQWLWRGYIPLGKITTLGGDPGLGKSTLTAYLAACVTQGLALPDGTACPKGGVVLLSAEDDDADTIRPRLDAAGADSSMVYHLTGVAVPGDDGRPVERDIYLPADLTVVEAAIREMGAILVVVDPLMAFLSSDVNSHRDQDVRGALRPMADLASRTGAAILLVRHLNKASIGNALYRGGGSIGIIGAARAGLLVAPDPDDPDSAKPNGRRVLAVQKINVGVGVPALTFNVVSAESNPDVGRIAWGAIKDVTAGQLLALPQDDDSRSLTDEAIDYLKSALHDGPQRADDLTTDAPKDIRGKPLRTARVRLGVQSRRIGFGKGSYVEWSLTSPSPVDSLSTDAANSTYMPSEPIHAHQTDKASMDREGKYGADIAEPCPTTGGNHETALLRTADGWLRCVHCDAVTNQRAAS